MVLFWNCFDKASSKNNLDSRQYDHTVNVNGKTLVKGNDREQSMLRAEKMRSGWRKSFGRKTFRPSLHCPKG